MLRGDGDRATADDTLILRPVGKKRSEERRSAEKSERCQKREFLDIDAVYYRIDFDVGESQYLINTGHSTLLLSLTEICQKAEERRSNGSCLLFLLFYKGFL